MTFQAIFMNYNNPNPNKLTKQRQAYKGTFFLNSTMVLFLTVSRMERQRGIQSSVMVFSTGDQICHR